MIGTSSVGSQNGPIKPIIAAKQIAKRIPKNENMAFLCYMKGTNRHDEDHVVVITTIRNGTYVGIHDVNGRDWIDADEFPTRILANQLTMLGIRWKCMNNSNKAQSITASNKCWSHSYDLYRKLTTRRHN